jgi:hypothetical protein
VVRRLAMLHWRIKLYLDQRGAFFSKSIAAGVLHDHLADDVSDPDFIGSSWPVGSGTTEDRNLNRAVFVSRSTRQSPAV